MDNANAKQPKILILNGSPQRERSTTMVMTRAFAAGLAEKTGATVETVTISDLSMKPCMGCLACWGRHEGDCVIRGDDIPAVKEKILAADYVIESFPVYVFGMPGILKMFTDRMLSMLCTYRGHEVPHDGSSVHGLRYPSATRKFIVISGCAYTEAEEICAPLRGQFDLICGKKNYTALFCPQIKALIDRGGARLTRALTHFRAAGEEFAEHGCLSPETMEKLTRPPFSPDVYRVIMEHVWEQEKQNAKTEEV